MKFVRLLVAVALLVPAAARQSNSTEQSPAARQVLLTLYSTPGSGTLLVPGKKPWGGHLWLDHRKVGLITPGQFLTLRLLEGDHLLAGEAFFARESTLTTIESLKFGKRYFMRLVIDSKAVAGIGNTRWTAEPVACEEAYSEAATLEPVKLKRVEKSLLNYVAREPYFPGCLEGGM